MEDRQLGFHRRGSPRRPQPALQAPQAFHMQTVMRTGDFAEDALAARRAGLRATRARAEERRRDAQTRTDERLSRWYRSNAGHRRGATGPDKYVLEKR